MYIADVVGSLRENYMRLSKELDAIRLSIALMESAMSKVEFRLRILEDMHPRKEREGVTHVSRETEAIEGDGNGSSSSALL